MGVSSGHYNDELAPSGVLNLTKCLPQFPAARKVRDLRKVVLFYFMNAPDTGGVHVVMEVTVCLCSEVR
jgi:hypothetical protein